MEAKTWGSYKFQPSGNKGKGTWVDTRTGDVARLGNRVLSQGKYYQLNSDGTVTNVGSIKGGFNRASVGKISDEEFQKQDRAMRTGLIYDKRGAWRLNSDDKKTKLLHDKETGRSYYQANDGKGNLIWTSFDTGLNRSADKDRLLKARDAAIRKKAGLPSEEDDSTDTWEKRFKKKGILGGLVDGLMDGLGVAEDSGWRTAADLASNFVYSIPGVGTAMGLGDAAMAALRGDWTGAGTALAFSAIPGGKVFRSAGKAMKGTLKGRAINAITPKSLEKVPLLRNIRHTPSMYKDLGYNSATWKQGRDKFNSLVKNKAAGNKLTQQQEEFLTKAQNSLRNSRTTSISDYTGLGKKIPFTNKQIGGQVLGNWAKGKSTVMGNRTVATLNALPVAMLALDAGKQYYDKAKNTEKYNAVAQGVVDEEMKNYTSNLMKSGLAFNRYDRGVFNEGIKPEEQMDENTFDFHRNAYLSPIQSEYEQES